MANDRTDRPMSDDEPSRTNEEDITGRAEDEAADEEFEDLEDEEDEDQDA